MTHIARFMVTALILSQCAFAGPQRNKPSLTFPSNEAIPQNYLDSMDRQEQRLDEINSKMVSIDTSLTDFKGETSRTLSSIDTKLTDMTTTNIVMKFVLAIIILVIPTIVGVWFAEHLKRRRPL